MDEQSDVCKDTQTFLAQIPLLLHLLMHSSGRDVYPELVGFLAAASCPQWLHSQTVEFSFIFPT